MNIILYFMFKYNEAILGKIQKIRKSFQNIIYYL